MAKLVQQSTANDPLFFFLTQSSDHITGLTGATPTVEISKNGAGGAAPSGAISQVDSVNLPGWYQVAGNATDTNTLGDILLHATATSADPCDMVVAQVVAFNPRNANLGLTNVSANVAQWNGTNVAVPGTAGIPDINVLNWHNGAVPAPNVTGEPLVDLNHIAGAALATHASGMVPSDVRDIVGVAVSTTTAQLGVNVVQYNAQTAQTDANNLPKVDVEAENGSTGAAQNVAKANNAIGRGTVGAASTTTSITTSAFAPGGAGIVSGQFIGRIIIFDGNTATAALQGQASNITANTSGATPTFTVTALTTAPASGDTFGVY